MTDDEYRQRQDDEVLAISAMYPDQLEDVRNKDAWNVWRPPHVIVRVSDAEEDDAGRSIKVEVKMKDKYPDVLPDISLIDACGLSDADVNQLKQKLLDLARARLGQEMVMDLVGLTSEFLVNVDRPVFRSLHEENVYHERRAEADVIECRQKQLESESAAVERRRQEVLLVQEERAREMKKHRRRAKTSAVSGNEVASASHSDGQDASHAGADFPRVRTISFESRGQQKLVCSRLDGPTDRGSLLYLGIDSITGAAYRVQQFALKISAPTKRKSKRDGDAASKDRKAIAEHMASFERELSTLAKLNHANLIGYVNLALVEETDGATLSIFILHEWAQALELTSFLRPDSAISPAQVRSVATDLCTALSHLHARDILHRDLRCGSVLLCSDGRTRLADFSLCAHVTDAIRRVGSSSAAAASRGVEVYPTSGPRGGKRADVHRLGVVLAATLQGRPVGGAREPCVPSGLPAPLADFLQRCLARDEQSRWTAEQLLEHGFLKQQLPSTVKCVAAAPAHEVGKEEAAAAAGQTVGEPTGDALALLQPTAALFELGCSDRLHSEYDVLEQAGQGGYGSVIKVRHKLDGQLYAIKQVVLDPRRPKECQKIVKEAIVLSRLQHDNVVRYFSAWMGSVSLDSVGASTAPSDDGARQSSTGEKRPEGVSEVAACSGTAGCDRAVVTSLSSRWNTSSRHAHSHLHTAGSTSSSSDSDDSGAWCPAPAAACEPSGDSVVFERATDDGSAYDQQQGEHCSGVQRPINADSCSQEVPVRELQYLFIQMEFCERKTLRTAIGDGLHADHQRIWRLYREILEGLHYIHRQGLIHRDLKPDNIFLQYTAGRHDLRVKLGDFGLAVSKGRRAVAGSTVDLAPEGASVGALNDLNSTTACERSQTAAIADAFECTGYAGVGTAHYRAPELCSGASTGGGGGGVRHYTNKVDIYSLGVIFFEMCHCAFATLAERHGVLERLRQPQPALPEDAARWLSDQQTQLVSWMLRHEPAMRPTAGELLVSDLVPPHSRDEAIFDERLRQALGQPASARFRRLVDACFARRQCGAADELYDSGVPRDVPSPVDAELVDSICRRLAVVFTQFGASAVRLPLLMPATSAAAAASGDLTDEHVETLMSGDGVLLQLARCLRVPLARLLGRTAAPPGRRFAVAPVYMRRRPGASHPRQRLEAVFSVSAPAQCESAAVLADAELVAVAGACLAALPPLSQGSGFTLSISHTTLMEAALVAAHVTPSQWPALLADLGRHQRYNSAEQIQSVLENYGLSRKTCVSLAALLSTRCAVSGVMAAFKGRGQAYEMCRPAVRHLEAVVGYAQTLGVTCEIQVHIGLIVGGAEHEHFGGGVLVQLARSRRPAAAGSTSQGASLAVSAGLEVLAAGGRCDRLLSRFWHLRPRRCASALPPPPFLCLTVFVERCVAAVCAESSSCPVAAATAAVSPFHAVVTDGGGDRCVTLRQLAVASRLRACGLCVYVYLSDGTTAGGGGGGSVASSTEDAGRWAREQRAAALVMPKPADASVVLVRPLTDASPAAAATTVVPTVELVDFLAGSGVVLASDRRVSHAAGVSASVSSSVVRCASVPPDDGRGDDTSAGVRVHWLSGGAAAAAAGGGGKLKWRAVELERISRSKRHLVAGRQRLPEIAALTAGGGGGGGVSVQLVVTELPEGELERLTALRLNDAEPVFWRSVTAVQEQTGGRAHRRIVTKLCDLLATLRVRPCAVLLYSEVDEACRVLICGGKETWR